MDDWPRMSALRILILSDGRPGHYHLSDGIAAAVGRLRPVEITRVEVSRGAWSGIVAATMVNSGVADQHTLRMLSGKHDAEFPPCDLIISAGAETLAPNVLLARMRGVTNVFYGSLRRFRPEDFALVLTSYERNASRPSHALALKPSAADPDVVRAGKLWQCGDTASTMGLLVGGNSGTFTFAREDWASITGIIEATHAASGIRWLVSNSRRTDESFSDELSRLAARTSGPVARFIDVRQAGAGTLGEIFAAADALLVTDDSSSMISEAIWMRLPVLGVQPRQARHTDDEQHYRDWLARSRWCATLPLADVTPDRIEESLRSLRPLRTNPLDALAALLAERLPALRPTKS